MSQWTKVDGMLSGVTADLSNEKTPQGSEGGSPLFRYHPECPWTWHVSLRDRGENDAPAIRDWFAYLCKRVSPDTATLEIDNGYSRYLFEWDANARLLRLDVPPLYRDEADSVLKWIANHRDSLPQQYREILAPWVTLANVQNDNFLTDAHLDSLKHLAEQDIIDNPWPEMANPPSPEETIALVTEIRRLRWTVAMYEAALIDKFGPNILDRFGDPPDGWMVALKGRRDG